MQQWRKDAIKEMSIEELEYDLDILKDELKEFEEGLLDPLDAEMVKHHERQIVLCESEIDYIEKIVNEMYYYKEDKEETTEKIYMIHYTKKNEGLSFINKHMFVYASNLQEVKKALKVVKVGLVRSCRECDETEGLEILDNNVRCKEHEYYYKEKLNRENRNTMLYVDSL